MGVADMNNMGFNADASRYDRQNRLNPPEFAPGQGNGAFEQDIFASSTVPSNSTSSGDIFGGSSGGDIFSSGVGNGAMGGDIFSSGVGGNSMGGGMDLFGSAVPPVSNNAMMPGLGNPMGTQPQTSPEDKFFETAGTIAKGGVSFFKDVAQSFKGLTPLFWQKFGLRTSIVSLVFVVLGIITRLFGFKDGLTMAIGACLSGAGGIVCFFMTTESARKCTSCYKEQNNTQQNFNQAPALDMQGANDFGFGNSGFGDSDFGSSDFGSSDFGSSGDSDFSFGDDDDDDSAFTFGADDDDDDDFSFNTEPEQVPAMSTEDALNSIQEVPNGMYTRQYLWDMFTKVLPTMKPDFSTIRDIDEDDDAFLQWGDSLREAAQASGSKDDNLPELLRLQENLFTIIATCDRPAGFKPEACATELANMYAYQGGEFKQGVFAKVDTIGNKCIFTIFTGATAMISLKDMMLIEKDFVLDSKNTIPVILGVDQLGKVIKADFRKLESIIVTGMPRTGKSWFVQAVLTQMCAFLSPAELNFYICDPKEGISDFKSFCLPHVKKFVSGDNAIVETLRYVVRVEGPRRKKLIGDAGFVNIWDYKERYPDIELPILYVVCDEVVTLAERMEKETKKEFMGYLVELISQLPAVGIRAFLVPHVIKNDIIPKTATDLVPCKISVCGDAEHIEKATGSKPKDFPYKLFNKGDMAVKLVNVPNTMYVHGPALTDSNTKNSELFDYLRRVWTKLQPNSVSDSVANGVQEEKDNQKLLNDFRDDSDTDAFFTKSTNEQNLFGINN